MTSPIGQLFIVRASGYLQDEDRLYPDRELDWAALTEAITRYQVGGILLYGGDCVQTPQKIQALQALSTTPLLICADLEEGAGQHFTGATRLPPAMALGHLGPAVYFEAGRITALEARALGVNWVLGPVADVNANPANPVINVRSFGASVDHVTEANLAFWQGLQVGGALGCAKHVPGHGDVDMDSHMALPVLRNTRRNLAQEHWPPFRALIAAGVETAMVAHLQVPSLDPSGLPASLSRRIVTDLLQEEWGFEGVVVTDALTMQAITDRYGPAAAAVLAFEAGSDLLLMPQDLSAAHQALMTGQITPARLQHSLIKIQRLKAQIAPASVSVPWAEHERLAHTWFTQCIQGARGPVAPHTVHVIVHPKDKPPVGPLGQLDALVLSEDSATYPAPCPVPVMVHLLLTTGPYRSCTRLSEGLQAYLAGLTQGIVVSYGNPYLLQDLPQHLQRVYAYSPQPMAQQAVLARFGLEPYPTPGAEF